MNLSCRLLVVVAENRVVHLKYARNMVTHSDLVEVNQAILPYIFGIEISAIWASVGILSHSSMGFKSFSH